jgi:hypothetical protein
MPHCLTGPLPSHIWQEHVALPYRDLVLGVQTRPPPGGAADAGSSTGAAAPGMHLDEQCGGAARWLDASAVRRPLLAALLQTGWGVAPPHVGWSMAHNASVTNWLWAVGRTPFGPYAARAELSFALRDAAARAALHALAAEVMREARALRDYFRAFRKQIDDVLTPAEHLPFLRRLNVFSFKLQRARSYLSLHNHRLAQYYLLSTRAHATMHACRRRSPAHGGAPVCECSSRAVCSMSRLSAQGTTWARCEASSRAPV